MRWITGGTLPDLHVTFQHEGNVASVRRVKCATCKNILGYLPAEGDQSESLAAMRQSGHDQ